MFAVGDTAPWSTVANSTNTALKRNPYFSPAPGSFTPKRPNEDFVAAVSAGRNAKGNLQFEQGHRPPIFSLEKPAPSKAPAATGSVMGYTHFDGATVTIESTESHDQHGIITDGSGFYGFAKLPPGEYRIEDCVVHVTASRVSRLDLPCYSN